MKAGQWTYANVHTEEHKRSFLIPCGDAFGDCDIFLGSFCMFKSRLGAHESHSLVSFENNCVYSMQRTEVD